MPEGITNIIFEKKFNQSLDNLPKSLEILIIGYASNYKNNYRGYYGTRFNKSLENLPVNLKKLVYHYETIVKKPENMSCTIVKESSKYMARNVYDFDYHY